MATYTQIFVSFLKIGATLFGGGYAMLPLLEREVVTNRGWCKSDEMADYYAMAQLVPGVIAINTSMLIGNRLRGWLGTVVAMLGVVFVPFLVILAYAILFDNLSHLSFLSHAMGGLRPAVAGMLLGVSFRMFRRSAQTKLGLFIALAVVGLVLGCGISAVTVILAGLAGGVVWWLAVWAMAKRRIAK